MNTNEAIIAAFDARAKRRDDRRDFFKAAGTAAAAVAATSMLGGCFGNSNNKDATPAPPPGPPPPTGPSDADILNFALNLEYLEAQFYSYAAFGTGLAANMLTGTGTQGAVIGGRKVNFTDPLVSQYAQEIAADEVTHVTFLRTQLGTSAVAQPAIDVGGTDPNGAFSSAARSAGLVGAGVAFDPYATDENFLLGAFIFEDVGVTAYKGASPLLTSKVYLEAAAGLLAAEAYHASLVRTVLYAKGVATPSLRTSADAISNARDSLDGASDDDQGISPVGSQSNIVPTDSSGIAFSRTAGQVLNVVFLNKLAVDRGGFFPAGVNGAIKTSAAN
ncbi:MAG: ferritin-like domain-containing protein [Sphingomonadaceae bacterium]|nr:ferritin-like domain-containing protein [Sphingomonadaceae bacterium]